MKRVTVHDVAKVAGVSTMTVSRVVNDSPRVAPATRLTVQRAIDDLGYVPDRLARSLVRHHSDVVALIIPDLVNPFYTYFARSVEDAAAERGYTVVVVNTDEDPVKEAEALRSMVGLRVAGVLLAACNDKSAEQLDTLRTRGTAFVLVDRSLRGVEADCVRGESRRAAEALTSHLLEHGHTRVGMITGASNVSVARDRESGFRKAMKSAGLTLDKGDIVRAAFTRESGREAAERLLDRPEPPTAVVAANNFLAFGLLDAAMEAGLGVPEDLAIAAFDDVEVSAVQPFLTCASQPSDEMGTVATRLLIDRIDGDESPPRDIVLDSELVIRRSCGDH